MATRVAAWGVLIGEGFAVGAGRRATVLDEVAEAVVERVGAEGQTRPGPLRARREVVAQLGAERGVAALALNMAEAEASALWERWWPTAAP